MIADDVIYVDRKLKLPKELVIADAQARMSKIEKSCIILSIWIVIDTYTSSC